jgi:hypothetical protein
MRRLVQEGTSALRQTVLLIQIKGKSSALSSLHRRIPWGLPHRPIGSDETPVGKETG